MERYEEFFSLFYRFFPVPPQDEQGARTVYGVEIIGPGIVLLLGTLLGIDPCPYSVT